MRAIKSNKAIDFGSECIITIAGTSFEYDMDGDYDFFEGDVETHVLNMLQGLDFYVDNVIDYSEDWEVVSPEVLFRRYFESFYDDERDENWQMFIDEVISSSNLSEQQVTSYFKKGRYCFQPEVTIENINALIKAINKLPGEFKTTLTKTEYFFDWCKCEKDSHFKLIITDENGKSVSKTAKRQFIKARTLDEDIYDFEVEYTCKYSELTLGSSRTIEFPCQDDMSRYEYVAGLLCDEILSEVEVPFEYDLECNDNQIFINM